MRLLLSLLLALLFIPAAAASTGGHLNVLILLLNYQDTQPYTLSPAQAQADFLTNAAPFYEQMSYGQTTITGQADGWYGIPYSVTGPCDQTGWKNAGKAAATTAGVNVAAFDHIIYVFSGGVSSCGSIAFGGGTLTSGFVLGGPNVVTDQFFSEHEFGHAIGLNEADLGPEGGQLDRLPAAQLLQLDWLDAPTVTSSASYTLTSVEQPSGLRALQIPRGDGSRLVLEYRSGLGLYVESDRGFLSYVYLLGANPCGSGPMFANQYFYDTTSRTLLATGPSPSQVTVTLNTDAPTPDTCPPPPPPPPPPPCHGHSHGCTGVKP